MVKSKKKFQRMRTVQTAERGFCRPFTQRELNLSNSIPTEINCVQSSARQDRAFRNRKRGMKYFRVTKLLEIIPR